MPTENKAREAIGKAFEHHEVKFSDEPPRNGTSDSDAGGAAEDVGSTEAAASTPEPATKPEAVSGDEAKKDLEKLATDAKSEPGNEKSPQIDAPKQEAQVASIEDAPPFWKSEHKALWAKITDPEVRKIIKENEAGRNRLTQHLKQVVNERIGQWADHKFEDVFPPERMRALALEGKTAAQATDALWAWNDYLEENPHAAIAEMMERYGVTPQDVHAHIQGAPVQQQQAPEDPRIKELLDWREKQETLIKQTRIRQELDAFGAEIENGKPLRPYWTEVKKYIKGILPLVYSENPDISDYEALHKAYEMAAYANPQVRAKLNGTQQNTVRFDAEKTQRAKEAASSLPSSSSNSAELPKTAKTARDALNMAWPTR